MTDPSLPHPHPSPWPLARSQALLERAAARIPGITTSMMKRPEHYAPGSFPVYLAGGRGAIVEDVDGNEYVDFVCGLGANSLGHGHPAVLAGIQETLGAGLLHSLPTELELEATDALLSFLPNAEMARFFKTGADATSAAVRLARALTGKPHIVTTGYNGWHDHFMFDTPGVPEPLRALTTRIPLFSPADEDAVLDVVRTRASTLAAVLLTFPYKHTMSRAFVHALREACTRGGVLLVCDEIVAGFRVSFAGAQALYDVTPDLSCYSKAIAAGMPLAAVVGPADPLRRMEALQVSTTFGGEQLSLAACVRALAVYRDTDYFAHVAALGRSLREGINAAAERRGSTLRVIGHDALPFFLFSGGLPRHTRLMQVFQGLMAARGILLRRDLNFICSAHTLAQIELAIAAAEDSLGRLDEGAP